MTQGERVKEIRKALNLTLEKFGDRLGVGKTAISKIEKGERSLTAMMAKSICNEYHVSSAYLENGSGEMFIEVPQTSIDELCAQYGLDDFDRVLIQEYLKMSADARKALKDYIRNVMKRVGDADPQSKIDREVEAYRKELEIEASRTEKSSVSDMPPEEGMA